MEENEFKRIYRDVNPDQCVYQKTILSGRYQCAFAQRINLAEREAIACQSAIRFEECRRFIETLIEKTRFALHRSSDEPITHSQAMKIQQGGLLGLKRELGIESAEIDGIFDIARVQYEDRDSLPFDVIVREVVHFNLRGRK